MAGEEENVERCLFDRSGKDRERGLGIFPKNVERFVYLELTAHRLDVERLGPVHDGLVGRRDPIGGLQRQASEISIAEVEPDIALLHALEPAFGGVKRMLHGGGQFGAFHLQFIQFVPGLFARVAHRIPHLRE